ncbi:GH92 family glycosyl hydrolase [Prolixibacteraceae bacterium Z1-6]|uniref:GH92 family glycosyl hydrolase n=1 Tax=Draconibacterium aestuarii TaxID=2998507 RepID=A0A9X3J4S4_9BACT|nr:GH92 family glycosyl hydrolase [Prolixibacteraceae bacterium Z1-6]
MFQYFSVKKNSLVNKTLFVFVLTLLASCKTTTSTITETEDPLKYVNTFICTEGDNGQLYPGPAYPFGLVHLSPETEGDSHVGYYYEDEFIEGFSHLRIGGAGSRGKGGGILVKPGIGKFTSKIEEFRERYDKKSEEASAGYYKLKLESGVEAELTVSERVGFHRYTFPEEQKKDRYIVLELSHSYVGMQDASFTVHNNRTITGMIKAQHNNGGSYHKLYFAMLLNTPFESTTTWNGDDYSDNENNGQGSNIGVWLHMPRDAESQVLIKVGLSPVSEEQALVEATTEINDWDFDGVRNSTASVWRDKLSKIEVKGGSEEHNTLLYTHLYHSYLVPNNATASNGDYRAVHQPDLIFNTKNTADDFTYYCTWSLWDDFRKYSLVSILEPKSVNDISRSLVDYYKHRANGDYKYWPIPNIRMEFASAVIWDAYNKGLGDFDKEEAFKGMKEDYENFANHNVSAKLERAYHAHMALKMAEVLGKTEEAAILKKGAMTYRDIWCPEQKDKQGNTRGFFTRDGTTVPDVEDFENDVYEGHLWHYRWFVLHDFDGLAELRGGNDKLSDDLEYFFENDFYMHVNEPDLHNPFLFNLYGKPYLTQKWVRTFTTKEVTQIYHNHGAYDEPVVGKIYRADPKGYIETMDDDAGTMASWFVMSVMGLFQIDMAKSIYQIGSPVFPEMILHLNNGNQFKITANNVSEDNFYIQSAKLNGNELNKSWIDYSTIMAGGSLEFEMGTEPNKEWGTE